MLCAQPQRERGARSVRDADHPPIPHGTPITALSLSAVDVFRRDPRDATDMLLRAHGSATRRALLLDVAINRAGAVDVCNAMLFFVSPLCCLRAFAAASAMRRCRARRRAPPLCCSRCPAASSKMSEEERGMS